MGSKAKWSAVVLEDEALIALDVEEALIDAGFSVLAVMSSCEDALRWLQRNTPDIAVLDIELRDGNCVAVVELLNDRSIPFVVHSGSAVTDTHDPIFLKGRWVSKPSLREDLSDAALATVHQELMASKPS